ncbi:uncharacterized protein LOC132616052 isoform X2 [Lycium barbarum]|nr:uncharacterized protein LOC132616052 isoform X2 [Lycium barbarum]
MPQSYFNDCFDNIIKPHFHFMTTEDVSRLYAYRSIEKKWAGNRRPCGMSSKTHLRPKMRSGIMFQKKMCKTNAENRKKQTVPHTGGSKPNSRRRAEMFAETGRRPGRAQLYLATHKKQDGSYVNEEAKEICEKIQLATSQSTMDESEISPNDAVGKVLGKEHSGRVRCFGLGATPSTHFKQTKPRVGGIRIPSNDAGCSSFGCQDKYDKLLNTLKAYMIMKEGSIPEQFAGIFGSPPITPSDADSS